LDCVAEEKRRDARVGIGIQAGFRAVLFILLDVSFQAVNPAPKRGPDSSKPKQ